jgi:hypothetical protein
MKAVILKFGKHKGQNFFDTPASYQTWLMTQDWFTQSVEIKSIMDEEKNRIELEKKQAEKRLNDELLFIKENHLDLVGKKINAYGWHYDNFGICIGTIDSVEIKRSGRLTEVVVHIKDLSEEDINLGRMENFTFKYHQYYTLLKNGELPKPNKLLNTGTEAEIITQ